MNHLNLVLKYLSDENIKKEIDKKIDVLHHFYGKTPHIILDGRHRHSDVGSALRRIQRFLAMTITVKALRAGVAESLTLSQVESACSTNGDLYFKGIKSKTQKTYGPVNFMIKQSQRDV